MKKTHRSISSAAWRDFFTAACKRRNRVQIGQAKRRLDSGRDGWHCAKKRKKLGKRGKGTTKEGEASRKKTGIPGLH